MKQYFESSDKILTNFKTNSNGLENDEALKRLEKNGQNKLVEGKKTSLIMRFLSQLTDPMIIILIAAAVVSGITSFYSGEGFTDVIIIVVVVLINAILGVYQESKAEKAIEALQKMTLATSKVLRDGHITMQKSENLVVGDIVLLEAGDAVPADGRIIESASLKIEESALTGESVPVSKIQEELEFSEKDIPLGDRINMIYMGSTVVYGRAKAVITSTGMDTEMGKIAGALSIAKDEKTPLQKKLSQLSKILTYAVIGICVFIFAFQLISKGDFSGVTMLNTFMIAVSLAVAAIPEGLAAVVTIVLSMGVTKMSAHNAVIRKLTAVETLGCAQIICSDKTGTLTQNKMTVTDYFSDDQKLLARAMALCCDAELDEKNNAVGEPTECALVNYAYSIGLNKKQMEEESPRISEAPFDSMRKMMSTVHQLANQNSAGRIIQFSKGAPDEVLKCCTHILKDGQIIVLNQNEKDEVLQKNKNFADQALRVLACAFKELKVAPSKDATPKELENNLVFIGLVGMIDPVRDEVCGAIEECRQAGIRPIMITGDHRDTAIAIAKKLGIIDSDQQAITGAQLDEMSDAEYEKTISNFSVYARVKPENKVRIVTTWKKKGFICAMTGDGVNDAPSIKNADIGIGMGITGTDVTKNVADMVLADDNFATIVGAVSEGRKIFDNIRKAIQFLLASNLSEVVSIFFATILGFTILKPVHLLWINLITDTFPALALGMEEGEDDAMQRPPRNPKESIFARGLLSDVLYQGVVVSILTLSAYFIGHFMESGIWEIPKALSPDGITMAFLTMSMAEIFHSFNMRSQTHSVFTLKKHNIYLWGAMIGSLILTLGVIYIPFLSKIFDFTPISFLELVVALGLAVCVIPIVEVVKIFKYRKIRKIKK